tara:strand:- start:103 stop:684 length:582 start_codon:yes stop_codon:yes gene_type:complete
MSSLKNNDEFNNEEIIKIFAMSKKNKKEDLTDNLDKYNSIKELALLNSDTLDKDVQNIESFRKYYLFQTKNFFDGNTFFGLIHIRLAFFVKEKSRYENYIKVLINKINKAIEISDKHNDIKGNFYVYLDLENANPKNFSRRFLKNVANVMNELYVDQLKNYFISGKKLHIKMFWPIISLFLDKKTKNKIICLN